MLRKSSSIQNNLAALKSGYNNGKDVFLDISLEGITVTSSQHQTVIMSHSLRNISYATCDPASCLFSFMARDSFSPSPLQQCHTFRLRTPCQAEELNSLVGEAFRAAYAIQMQKEHVVKRNEIDQSRMTASRSTGDLLSSNEESLIRKSLARRSLNTTTSSMNLATTEEAPRKDICISSCLPVSPVAVCDYSQVWDNEDSIVHDSGISSTSSNSSHSSRHRNAPKEELSSTVWYQGEMQKY